MRNIKKSSYFTFKYLGHQPQSSDVSTNRISEIDPLCSFRNVSDIDLTVNKNVIREFLN